jgi:MFS family permease
MKSSRYRWFVVSTFFAFFLLHQADKLLIGPLTSPIMETFGINEARMGLVFSGAVFVGAVCYPLWGFLFDLFQRSRLLALASLLWGATTWLSALARTFPFFLVTRASTGIDDSCYPGIYSTVADYFEPRKRGRVNGLLSMGGTVGYLLAMVLGILLQGAIGWRNVFLLTGGLGILLSLVIFFFIKEPPRGVSEPELAGVAHAAEVRFNWKTVRGLFRKPSLLFLFASGFVGASPWAVINFWIFRYLETERGYAQGRMFVVMVIVVLVLAGGYPLSGLLGDRLFCRLRRGRLILSATGVLLGAVCLAVAITTPPSRMLFFEIMFGLAALFAPLDAPNCYAAIYDITEPEVRSTAMATINFVESIGSAFAPALAGLIAVRASLGTAILGICTGASAICFVFVVVAAVLVPRDIERLRAELQARAAGKG